jgi:hypothetical protein
MVRVRLALLPAASSIPDMIPGIEQCLASLIHKLRAQQALATAPSTMQEQRAQQVLADVTAMNAASHCPPNQKAEPPPSQLTSLAHLQRLVQPQRSFLQEQLGRHGDGLMPAPDLLQALPGLLPTSLPFGSLDQGLTTLPPDSGLPTIIQIPAPLPYGRYGKTESFPGLLPTSLPFGSLAQGLTTLPPDSGLPTTITIPVPLPYGRYGKTESFPRKLYRLLAEVESQGNTHIISFTPDGAAVKIHDPAAFLEHVSPSTFASLISLLL